MAGGRRGASPRSRPESLFLHRFLQAGYRCQVDHERDHFDAHECEHGDKRCLVENEQHESHNWHQYAEQRECASGGQVADGLVALVGLFDQLLRRGPVANAATPQTISATAQPAKPQTALPAVGTRLAMPPRSNASASATSAMTTPADSVTMAVPLFFMVVLLIDEHVFDLHSEPPCDLESE